MAKRGFHSSLLINLILGPLFLGVTLFGVDVFSERLVERKAAEELTNRSIAEIETRLAAYLKPVEEIAHLGTSLGQAGYIKLDQPIVLDPVFGSLLNSVPQISSLHVASQVGEEYMMLREPDGSYFGRLSDSRQVGAITTRVWQDRPTVANRPLETREASDYDVMQRPWFTMALESAPAGEGEPELVWSSPYKFFTTGDPGITASAAYKTPDGQTQVFALDILLNDVVSFVEDSRVRQSGMVFVLLREQGQEDLIVIALPSRSVAPRDFPYPASQLEGVPRILSDLVFSQEVGLAGEPLRFQALDAPWWGAVARSNLSNEKEIWIAAAVPEAEILAGIPKVWQWALAVLALTLLVVAWRARRLAAKYAGPMSALVRQTERLGRLNFEQKENIETDIREIEALAKSQEVTRQSLSALSRMDERAQLAIEIRSTPAAMKVAKVDDLHLRIHDAPGRPCGGTIAAQFPVTRQGGKFELDNDSSQRLIAVVGSELSGLTAAQCAAGVRAAMRTKLADGAAFDDLAETLRQEVRLGSAAANAISTGFIATMPSARLAVHLDNGALLAVRTSESEACSWIDAPRELTFEPGSVGLLLMPQFFDHLDQDRRSLTRETVNGWMAELLDTADEGRETFLAEQLENWTGPDNRETLFVIVSRS